MPNRELTFSAQINESAVLYPLGEWKLHELDDLARLSLCESDLNLTTCIPSDLDGRSKKPVYRGQNGSGQKWGT